MDEDVGLPIPKKKKKKEKKDVFSRGPLLAVLPLPVALPAILAPVLQVEVEVVLPSRGGRVVAVLRRGRRGRRVWGSPAQEAVT